jgi:hypothetical protein
MAHAETQNRGPEGEAVKLKDIEPGSDVAYREAVKMVRNQIEFELETCEILLGTDPERVRELIADPNYDSEGD